MWVHVHMRLVVCACAHSYSTRAGMFVCSQVSVCAYILPRGCNNTSLAAGKHINLSNTNSERRSGEDRENVCLCGCVRLEEEGVNERDTPPPELRRGKKKKKFGFHEALEI